jgi:nucleoside-diphosphate-sugar epimerase
MLTGEKILVTGASGLVGMQLCGALAAENEVWGVSRYLAPEARVGAINAWAVGREKVEALGVKTVAADLLGDLSEVPRDFTYVLHLAHTRLGADRIVEAVTINSLSAGRILNHCRNAKAALVMSSTAIYSYPKEVNQPLLETAEVGAGVGPFSNVTSPASKISLEAVARFCADAFALPVTIARLNVCYGPGGGMPIRDMDRIVAGQPIERFGDPYPHSPIHFDDMNDQLEALLDAASTQATLVNWGGDEVVSQRQWCEQSAALSGKTPILNWVEGAPGDIADPTKRRSITGPCRRRFAEGFADVYRARHGQPPEGGGPG